MDHMDQQTVQTIAAAVAAQLNEEDPVALSQIRRMVERVGEAQVRAFIDEALAIEANGGMTIKDGGRRRTLGGVFFYIAKGKITAKDDRVYIWRHLGKRKGTQTKPSPVQPPPPPFRWEDRLAIIPALVAQKGEASTVKITLIGRPGKIVERGNVVLTSMQNTKTPPLPKGLPQPPDKPTTYIVFIARKQWRRVAEAIDNPDDSLIVEGYPAFDERLKAMTVFATNTTTKLLQRASRQSSKSD